MNKNRLMIGISKKLMLPGSLQFASKNLEFKDLISIDNITFGSTIIPPKTAEFLFISFLLFFGTTLLFGGTMSLYLNRETKSLGI